MKNILIPTDFSENSWNAIKYALEFFTDKSCNFYLLHVTLLTNYSTSDSPIFPTNTSVEKTILKQAKSSLITLLKKINKLPKNKKHHFYTQSTYNFFIDAIRNQIEEKNIDLIVMGTKGASGLNEVIMGSNTGDLITQVKCPVLIIPEDTTFKAPKEIAFPTDYNIYYQHEILNHITEFSKMFDSTIRVLHITKKKEELTEFQQENKQFLHTYLVDEKHSFHTLTNRKIEQGIQCFVESREVDMIIMIAKNVNLFQRILFKPLVEDISYHTEIPFLVLHE